VRATFVTECKVDEGVILRDQATGEAIATVVISSVIQRSGGFAVRLGCNAPKTVQIARQQFKGVSSEHGQAKPQ
jgi:sRNA-binding carbon storage regulator CsrA